MNLDFNLFVFLIGFIFLLPILGYIFRFNIPISLFFFIAGVFMLSIFLTIENLEMDSFLDGDSTITYYDVETRSFEQSIFTSTNTIQAEELQTSSSQLFGDTINCLTTWLRITGSPPVGTLIQYGVWDVNGNLKYEIGTMNRTMLTTSATPYKLCNFSSDYMLVTGDRIGVKYQAGNSTNAIVMQLDANNPFDSTITRQSRFDSGTLTWTSFTANDYMGIISLEQMNGESIVSKEFDISLTGENYQLNVIMIFVSVMLMVGGALVEVKQR